MNYTKPAMLFAVVFILLTSCKNEKSEQEVLYNQVMEVHDDVMPKMGDLMGLTKQLKLELDSVMSNDVENQRDQIIEIKGLITELETANDDMMQWMRDFEPTKEGTPHAEVMQFLTEEKSKISKVRDDMLSAKERAELFLSAR